MTEDEQLTEQLTTEQRCDLEFLRARLGKRGIGWRSLEPHFAKFGATGIHDLKPEHVPAAIDMLKVLLATLRSKKTRHANKPNENGKATLHLINVEDVKAEAIDYIWQARLARGKHTMISGPGGKGKSQIAYAIAATITRGRYWPDGGTRAPQGTVIILSAEEGVKDMIAPRLAAAGAKLDKVKILEAVRDGSGDHKFSLQADIDKLKDACKQIGDVVLIILDPLSSYLGTEVDTHRNSAVRAVLDPVNKLADDLGCAILSISHFNKGGSKTAVNRVMESAAFVNAPRMSFGVFDDPEFTADELVSQRYLMLQIKTNLHRARGIAYRVKEVDTRLIDKRTGNDVPILAPRIVWDGLVDVTADEVAAMEQTHGGGGKPSPELDRTEDWLRGYLANGPRDASEVKAASEAQSISTQTLRRARETIGVVTEQIKGKAHTFTWELPKTDKPASVLDPPRKSLDHVQPVRRLVSAADDGDLGTM